MIKLKDFHAILRSKGFEFKSQKFGHQKWYNSTTNQTVTVPRHGNKEIGTGLYKTILKRIEIDDNDKARCG